MSLRDLALIVARSLRRRPLRTCLTVLGVALSVTLFVAIESFSAGLEQALHSGDKARTLVVYRQNRYCPQTSLLPERYVQEIASIDGVESVLPVKVFLNNCRTNLDMIAFHGAPVQELLAARDVDILSGDLGTFSNEPDAALVGRAFAQRRNLDVGDKFQFGDIVVKVAGIYASTDTTQEALVLTHLEFLQRSKSVNRLGTVTQFEVKVADPARADAIANMIDTRFATAEEPTDTRAQSAFLARATTELREILGFARLFGVVCVLFVAVLVGNTIVMAVHERRRELGIFRAIGFKGRQLVVMVLAEATTIALVGGVLGWLVVGVIVRGSGFAIGVEGVQVGAAPSWSVAAMSFALVVTSAVVAGLLPALRAGRTGIVSAIRGGA